MKKKKIKQSEALLSFIGNSIMIETEDGEIDLVEELKQMSAMYESLSIDIKEFKEKKDSQRKPIAKYECSCGKVIKTTEDELDIICKKCNQDFKLKE